MPHNLCVAVLGDTVAGKFLDPEVRFDALFPLLAARVCCGLGAGGVPDGLTVGKEATSSTGAALTLAKVELGPLSTKAIIGLAYRV
jgi:hypothetical protein